MEHALFATHERVDPYLSRAHLRWLGPGRVHLARPARLRRGLQVQGAGPGEVALRVDDVLQLTPSTRLWARP